jgi:hypothetical protein
MHDIARLFKAAEPDADGSVSRHGAVNAMVGTLPTG